jgi:hypothetical protein
MPAVAKKEGGFFYNTTESETRAVPVAKKHGGFSAI